MRRCRISASRGLITGVLLIAGGGLGCDNAAEKHTTISGYDNQPPSPRRRSRCRATAWPSSSIRSRRSTAAVRRHRDSTSRCRSSSRRSCRLLSMPGCALRTTTERTSGDTTSTAPAPSWPARTIEARAERRDDGNLHQQPRQHAAQKSADRRSDHPLGRPARHDRRATTASTVRRSRPLAPTLRRPDPHRRPPARQRGPFAIRRTPRRLVDAGVR